MKITFDTILFLLFLSFSSFGQEKVTDVVNLEIRENQHDLYSDEDLFSVAGEDYAYFLGDYTIDLIKLSSPDAVHRIELELTCQSKRASVAEETLIISGRNQIQLINVAIIGYSSEFYEILDEDKQISDIKISPDQIILIMNSDEGEYGVLIDRGSGEIVVLDFIGDYEIVDNELLFLENEGALISAINKSTQQKEIVHDGLVFEKMNGSLFIDPNYTFHSYENGEFVEICTTNFFGEDMNSWLFDDFIITYYFTDDNSYEHTFLDGSTCDYIGFGPSSIFGATFVHKILDSKSFAILNYNSFDYYYYQDSKISLVRTYAENYVDIAKKDDDFYALYRDEESSTGQNYRLLKVTDDNANNSLIDTTFSLNYNNQTFPISISVDSNHKISILLRKRNQGFFIHKYSSDGVFLSEIPLLENLIENQGILVDRLWWNDEENRYLIQGDTKGKFNYIYVDSDEIHQVDFEADSYVSLKGEEMMFLKYVANSVTFIDYDVYLYRYNLDTDTIAKLKLNIEMKDLSYFYLVQKIGEEYFIIDLRQIYKINLENGETNLIAEFYVNNFIAEFDDSIIIEGAYPGEERYLYQFDGSSLTKILDKPTYQLQDLWYVPYRKETKVIYFKNLDTTYIYAINESKNTLNLLAETSDEYVGEYIRHKHYSGYMTLPFLDSDYQNTTIFTDGVETYSFRLNDHFPFTEYFNSFFVNSKAIVSQKYGNVSKIIDQTNNSVDISNLIDSSRIIEAFFHENQYYLWCVDPSESIDVFVLDADFTDATLIETFSIDNCSGRQVEIIGLARDENEMYFALTTEEYGYEIWTLNFDDHSINLLSDLDDSPNGSYGKLAFFQDDYAYFTAREELNNYQLWRLPIQPKKITSTNNVELQSIVLYPNPSHTHLNINESLTDIKVHAINGYEVTHGIQVKNIGNLNISGLANGIYFLSGINSDGKKVQSRFVKI